MTTQDKIRELKAKATEYMWLAEIVEQYKDIAAKIEGNYIVTFAPLHSEENPYRLNPHYPINGSYIIAALQSRIKDMEAEMAEIEKQLEPCTSQRKHPKR